MTSNDNETKNGGRSSDNDVSKKGSATSRIHASPPSTDKELNSFEKAVEGELNVTEHDLSSAKAHAETLSLECTRKIMTSVLAVHKRDPNFPYSILVKSQEFVANEDVFENPDKYQDLIWEMKLEAALITTNSPYAEVRAVVDNHDDPLTPCSTIRAWVIGIFFSVFLSGINELFSIRMPPIFIGSNVAQLLAFPLGRAWQKFMPNYSFKLFGTEHSLNPGPFNKKEHMLITIMATAAQSGPYSDYTIWVQVLPTYFDQPWARDFGYRILLALSTNFLGYGLAGLARKFLVYPSYCMWPTSLVTIALNSALHDDFNTPVLGPLKKTWSMSRYRFFMAAFAAMFIYFWFPNFIMPVLTYFSWMTWIAPNNHTLNILTGFNNGIGLLNPLPTFDWNVVAAMIDPLQVPAFTTFNYVGGAFIGGCIIVIVYFQNVWNTGYLPIVTNRVFDHFGNRYKVTNVLDDRGMYSHEKYMSYSAAYLGAANVILYLCFFAVYSSTVTYVLLFHRHEISMGFRNLWRSFSRKRTSESEIDESGYTDVHTRLMNKYSEVSEYWFLGVLLCAAAFGFACIAGYPTYTSAAVVPYGVLLALIFVVPLGIIRAVTGVGVTLNVLAEFIGGMVSQGNALSLNLFKSFGYVTCSHALSFSQDLKLAHYLKIPPRHTFAAQMIATLITTFVSAFIMGIQFDFKDVCDPHAPMRFSCPGNNTFFTAAVLWGTIGPLKVFGAHGQYAATLLGWPLGAITPIILYFLVKKYPHHKFLRQVHPVALWNGPIGFTPYSFSYMWPAVPFAWLSWIYIRSRYLAFWSKYNFVLSAALSAGIAISGLIMLFTVQWLDIELDWWGVSQSSVGCEDEPCTLKTLGEGERFYPWWDGSKVPAP